jgi:alkylated DNA repair dioxygenase AlkB
MGLCQRKSTSRQHHDRVVVPSAGATDVPDIPGLDYVADFITSHEEAVLVGCIDREQWDTSWERRRQLYGASYGKEEARRPLPDWAVPLIERFGSLNLIDRPFDQMLVNEYQPGQGIAMHRDYDPFDRTVVSLSLLSPCVMVFRCVADDRRDSMLLERRSLLELSDTARYDWEHGIARRKKDQWQARVITRQRRISVTFRVLRTRS